ncbi:MAG: hypothetical protein AB7S68_38035 [Polyangiaceae bacterium]
MVLLVCAACTGAPPAPPPAISVPAAEEPQERLAAPEREVTVSDSCPTEGDTSCLDAGDCGERCERGETYSCFALAARDLDWELGRRTAQRAMVACSAGDGVACRAVFYGNGRGFSRYGRSELEAAAQHGCEANCADSCLSLAGLKCPVSGSESDHARDAARGYLQKACDLGRQDGCEAVSGTGFYRCE